MSSEYITSEVCKKVLQNRFNNADIEFVKYEITSISDIAEGFMGEHMNLIITYKLHNEFKKEIFFLKQKSTKNKIQRNVVESFGVYKREIFVYDVLFKEFNKYGLDISFAAKCFYCVPNEILILENVKTNGYILLDRQFTFNTEILKCVLKQLALLHAAGFVYEKIKSKELNRDFKLDEGFQNNLKELFYVNFIDKNLFIMKFWDSCMVTLSSLIDLLPKDKEFNSKFKSMFQTYEFGKIFVDHTNFKKTFGHGDLWSNNMMFRSVNGKLEMKICDFQFSRYFYPALDLVLAIFCNTNKAYREKNLDILYKFYYDSLSKIMEEYGYNIKEFLTLDELYKTIALIKVDALAQVVFANTFVCLPKEKINRQEENGKKFDDVMFHNHKLATECFQTNELFRSIITEGLYEIYDAILNK